MSKSRGRDIQIFLYILKNIQKIKDAMKHFECDFSDSSKSIIRNTMAFDLCAMYMAQIGEHVKNLTDESQATLKEEINIEILRYFRNVIDHDYEKINKQFLKPYIQQVISSKAEAKIKKMYAELIENNN